MLRVLVFSFFVLFRECRLSSASPPSIRRCSHKHTSISDIFVLTMNPQWHCPAVCTVRYSMVVLCRISPRKVSNCCLWVHVWRQLLSCRGAQLVVNRAQHCLSVSSLAQGVPQQVRDPDVFCIYRGAPYNSSDICSGRLRGIPKFVLIFRGFRRKMSEK